MLLTYELVLRPRALNAFNVRTCTNASSSYTKFAFLRIDTHVNYHEALFRNNRYRTHGYPIQEDSTSKAQKVHNHIAIIHTEFYSRVSNYRYC